MRRATLGLAAWILLTVGNAAAQPAITMQADTARSEAPTCTWTDNPIIADQTPLRAQHINEIRDCIDAILRAWPTPTPQPPRPPILTPADCTADLRGEILIPGRSFMLGGSLGACRSLLSPNRYAEYVLLAPTQPVSVFVWVSGGRSLPRLDPYLAIWSGLGGNASTLIASDSDVGGEPYYSELTIYLAPGTYTLEVSSALPNAIGSYLGAIAVRQP